MEGTSQNKRVRDDSDELELNSPEVKRLRENLLDGFDESDPSSTTPEDLDSFMRSFEEEITASSSSPPPPHPVVTRFGESGESNMGDLGYLLEASDDELGLPPSSRTPVSEVASNEEMERNEFGDLWRFDDQIPSYDSFELGMWGGGGGGEEEEKFLALEGLFD